MAIVADVCSKTKLNENSPACPVCQKSGQKVNNKTVRNLIKEEKTNYLSEEEHFICLSPECPVSYYTEAGEHFKKDDLKVPIWFKEESPVPICYCKDVTDEDILNHIVKKQCCTTMDDIKAHTGANTGKECLTKNPTGR